ncbi:MAG TPA: hypothetical protein VMM84_04575 [Pyrinomonadaceae bacterium]|nr:hypothetical protein [Pyrinomonadaceae bacterium]
MSKKVNVNPDHYKTAGRERQGDDIVQEIHRQKFAQAKAADKRASKKVARKQKAKKSGQRRTKS